MYLQIPPATWVQNYDPLGNAVLSTVAAASPIVLLFYLLAVRRTVAWCAALYAFLAAAALAVAVFHMPLLLVAGSAAHGGLYALIRLAWTLVSAVFVYDVTVESGHFTYIKEFIGGLTDDRRLQVLLIAFAFGAFLEGTGGGGAPVAICGAMMIGLGFRPLQAAILCLIANTAPVAWGGAGNPIFTLAAVTGLSESHLSAMVGRILPLTTLILPFWLIRTQVSTRETLQVWPGALACGVGFGAIQFAWSNYVDGVLVDLVSGVGTVLWLAVFFRFWKPTHVWRFENDPVIPLNREKLPNRKVFHAASPFLLLAAFVLFSSLPQVNRILDRTTPQVAVPGLHLQVNRTTPIVAANRPEPAVFEFAWLSCVGTSIFVSGLVAGPILGLSLRRTLRVLQGTLYRLRFSILAVVAMLALGFVMRYSGMDAALGLAAANTGWLYPFFGTLIGWLGVAIAGSDAGSNALFGSLQVITAQRLGLSPLLMASANSAGGVLGKMIAAQSIIVACATTNMEGKEGDVFRAVIKHSIALALIVASIVMMYAYLLPSMIPQGH